MESKFLSKPLTKPEINVFCTRKYYVVTISIQGWRKAMEDTHCVLVDDDNVFLGVFDGHNGVTAAIEAKQRLHEFITKQEAYIKGDIKTAIEMGFMDFDRELRNNEQLQVCGGSTATTVFVKNNKIFCGSIGDSSAILVSESEDIYNLTSNHVPTTPSEKERILMAGSKLSKGKVNGHLAISRAFGDFRYKNNTSISDREQAVTSFPEVKEKEIDEKDLFILLATDGFWGMKRAKDVAKRIKNELSTSKPPEKILEDLAAESISRHGRPPCPGRDNVTAVLLVFNEFGHPGAGEPVPSSSLN